VIYDAADFVFSPPPEVKRARRVLIKPNAGVSLPHPMTTSRETLGDIVRGIRKVSDADIIFLEGTYHGEPTRAVFKQLGYDFPRVIVLDVQDCIAVEVENPLPKPFALANVWVPNIVLSCDYLISVASLKIYPGGGSFSVKNLVGLLPLSKYHGDGTDRRGDLHRLGIQKVVADLYFTVPFDMGIIDGRKRFIGAGDDPTEGLVEDYGKIFVGEPFEVDKEASETLGIETEYVRLIAQAKREFGM